MVAGAIPSTAMSDAPKRVFISYSQDSAEHGARVLALAQALRDAGIDAWLDQFEDAPAQGWAMWMHEQLRDADTVLVVASKGYRDKFERNVPRGVGKGVKFESHLILNEFYALEARTNRFVPVAFDRADVAFVPTPLQQHTHYVLPDGQAALRDWLLGRRPAHRQPRPIGGGTGESAGGDEEGSRDTLAQAQRRREDAVIAGASPDVIATLDAEIHALRAALREGPPIQTNDELGHGRYRLVEFVAKGGFAEVWKAYDRTDRRFVAIKILHGYWARDASKVERFEAAARKVKTLHHEAIVPALPIVPIIDGPHREAGRHYFVMPWLAGGDLHRARARLTAEQALAALARALEGLMHIHARGWVHRDVKPHNVLLDEQGRGWLSDFDLVLDDRSSMGTHTHAGMGSFVYAAQELQEDAKGADVRADVYGVAMTIVFALLGRDPPAYVAALQPRLIEGLAWTGERRAVLVGALAYAREQRTTSCAELLAALRGGPGRVAVEGPKPVTRSARGNVELVWIPGGSFMMGSPDGEGYDDERPRHRVALEGFYLARTPVTNASYAMFLTAHPKHAKPEYWARVGFNQSNQPVVGISWQDAAAFCTWAGLTLPSEAQWEYACRAGTHTRYWSGDDVTALARVGWYGANSGDRLHAVAELPANPWGLHDIHGNVWEWCLDGSPNSRYSSYTEPVRPGDGLRRQPVTGARRVVRGGCFDDSADVARSACRVGSLDVVRSRNLGFRPARAHR